MRRMSTSFRTRATISTGERRALSARISKSRRMIGWSVSPHAMASPSPSSQRSRSVSHSSGSAQSAKAMISAVASVSARSAKRRRQLLASDHLGGLEQPRQRHLHRYLPVPKRSGDSFDSKVGSGEDGDVAEGNRSQVLGLGIEHRSLLGDQAGDSLGDRKRPLVDVALDDPRGDRRHVDLVPLVAEDDEFAGNVPFKRRMRTAR